MNNLAIVLTTIQPPTDSVVQLYTRLKDFSDISFYVIGDKKGPSEYNLESHECSRHARIKVDFKALNEQLESPFELAQKLPLGHYSRKNLGYLYAVSQGAKCIYETDDDNAPLEFWQTRNEHVNNVHIVDSNKDHRWINIYRYFSKETIWPRGLPLDEIHTPVPRIRCNGSTEVWSPIQQGLVNNSPDVDAIWRLVMGRPFDFENNQSVYLTPGNWCPFNTQSTWWWPVAYPLLYIPSYCSFRMCDIWKSFVAQRCLWEVDAGITFHAPEVVQERNVHNLMHDFRNEIPGYERNDEIILILDNLKLKSGSAHIIGNLQRCYEALVKAKIFPEDELNLLKLWLDDIENYIRY
ncbi:DUF288 domain-containing protein [candidate division KSB1 bacterium]|nr:DUF288 domain-containing protein [candidate division KSB1 bacterium]